MCSNGSSIITTTALLFVKPNLLCQYQSRLKMTPMKHKIYNILISIITKIHHWQLSIILVHWILHIKMQSYDNFVITTFTEGLDKSTLPTIPVTLVSLLATACLWSSSPLILSISLPIVIVLAY